MKKIYLLYIVIFVFFCMNVYEIMQIQSLKKELHGISSTVDGINDETDGLKDNIDQISSDVEVLRR